MIPDTFDHSMGATVANAETFCRDPSEVGLARGGTVENDITDQNIFFGPEGTLLRWVYDEFATRETLTDIVIGIPFHLDSDPGRQPGTKALARGAIEFDVDGIFRKQCAVRGFGDLVR